MIQTTTRNATMEDLAALLVNQNSRKIDMVIPASQITARDANLVVTGAEPILEDDGVTDPNGAYLPTKVADEHLADKLGIPVAYLRRLRGERPDLYDANVNGFLHGRKAKGRWEGLAGDPDAWVETRPGVPGDPRSFLLRTFKGDHVINGEDRPGIARALLSDRYAVIDHLDALTAALDGVRQAGVDVEIVSADLTDRRMVVRVAAPAVQALAPELLRGYRSPFTGESGTDNPVLFAGFQISNSETGGGAFSITPRMVVRVCSNGMTVTKDAMRAVHLGGKMEEGLINWSAETQQKQLEVITSRTADAVRTFLDRDYMVAVIERLSAAAGKPVETVEEVRVHTKRLGFSQEHIEGVLSQFVKGGQMTLGGVTNAITAYAQTVEDGDEAYVLEGKALNLLSA